MPGGRMHHCWAQDAPGQGHWMCIDFAAPKSQHLSGRGHPRLRARPAQPRLVEFLIVAAPRRPSGLPRL
eukprot:6238611-Pyramimonas_sp.AAC.1